MNSVAGVWREQTLGARGRVIREDRRARPRDDRELPEHPARQSSKATLLLRQGPQRVAISRHDFFSFLHLLLEGGIIRREAVITLCGFNEKEFLSISRLQTADNFFGQNDSERISKFSYLEFNQNEASCYYNCNNKEQEVNVEFGLLTRR